MLSTQTQKSVNILQVILTFYVDLLMILVKNKNAFYSIPRMTISDLLPPLRRICFWNQAFITLEAYLWNTVSSYQTVLRQPQPLKVKRHNFCLF